MFIELVESLRCPRPHEVTWLVAETDTMRGRDIITGVLGCPVCRAEYPIANGVADFTMGETRPEPDEAVFAPADLPERALRLAALLGLTEPGGLVTLAGEWTAAARALGGIVEDVHVLALDPVPGLDSGEGVSIARIGTALPLRPATCRGIALDAAHATAPLLQGAVDSLRARGRLIAPASAPVIPGLLELARDEREWTAVKELETGPVVRLRIVEGGKRKGERGNPGARDEG